jgi:hypothetical protein
MWRMKPVLFVLGSLLVACIPVEMVWAAHPALQNTDPAAPTATYNPQGVYLALGASIDGTVTLKNVAWEDVTFDVSDPAKATVTKGTNNKITVAATSSTDPQGVEVRLKIGTAVFKKVVFVIPPNVSAYSTQYGCFAGYAERCTGNSRFAFATGKDLIDGLAAKTNTDGSVGNLYIFCDAWEYQSTAGAQHDGGVYGGGPNWSGFYGQAVEGDHADSRTLADLQTAIDNGTIRFARKCKLNCSGCRVYLTGNFWANLKTAAGADSATACCIGSEERTDGEDKMYFEAVNGSTAEQNDNTIYHGWRRNGPGGVTDLGTDMYFW